MDRSGGGSTSGSSSSELDWGNVDGNSEHEHEHDTLHVVSSAYVARLLRLVDAPSYAAYAAALPDADYLYSTEIGASAAPRLAALAHDTRAPAAWSYDGAAIVDDAAAFVRALYWFDEAPCIADWRRDMRLWGFACELRNGLWRFSHARFAHACTRAAETMLRPPLGLTDRKSVV